MSLETLTANEAEAVKRYLEPSFQVVLKPYKTTQAQGLTIITCNYCKRSRVAGSGFTHSPDCPEFLAKRPPCKEVAITRIFHMTAYAEVDEKGILIIP